MESWLRWKFYILCLYCLVIKHYATSNLFPRTCNVHCAIFCWLHFIVAYLYVEKYMQCYCTHHIAKKKFCSIFVLHTKDNNYRLLSVFQSCCFFFIYFNFSFFLYQWMNRKIPISRYFNWLHCFVLLHSNSFSIH